MQNTADFDATTIQLKENSAPADVSFPAVAVNNGQNAPRNIMYIAQQTSLEDYTPGLNPLVNAAAHLLLDILKFRNNHQDDIEILRTRLEAEIRGFEAQAIASGVEHSHVLAARYVLCTALDESITTSQMGETGTWSRLALLSTFHNETWGGEKFFQILDRCMQQPARNLYLLEFMYLLLSLGFEGKYRVLDRGPITLEALRDKMYRQVRLLRGEPSPDLCKKIDTSNIRDKVYAYIPLWLIACGVLFCLSATFWGFSLTLDSKANPLLNKLNSSTSQPVSHVAPVSQELQSQSNTTNIIVHPVSIPPTTTPPLVAPAIVPSTTDITQQPTNTSLPKAQEVRS